MNFKTLMIVLSFNLSYFVNSVTLRNSSSNKFNSLQFNFEILQNDESVYSKGYKIYNFKSGQGWHWPVNANLITKFCMYAENIKLEIEKKTILEMLGIENFDSVELIIDINEGPNILFSTQKSINKLSGVTEYEF